MSVPPRRPAVRRLTLAPAPASVSTGARIDAERSWVIEAHLPNGGPPMSADPLAGRRSKYGSRFWPLADELSSDGEDDVVEEHLLFPMQSCRPGADRSYSPCQEPSATPSAAGLTPNGYVVASVAGLTQDKKMETRERPVGNRTRSPATSKPWRGPLPPARASPRFTLADALAKARGSFHTGSGCWDAETLAGAIAAAAGRGMASGPVVPGALHHVAAAALAGLDAVAGRANMTERVMCQCTTVGGPCSTPVQMMLGWRWSRRWRPARRCRP